MSQGIRINNHPGYGLRIELNSCAKQLEQWILDNNYKCDVSADLCDVYFWVSNKDTQGYVVGSVRVMTSTKRIIHHMMIRTFN